MTGTCDSFSKTASSRRLALRLISDATKTLRSPPPTPAWCLFSPVFSLCWGKLFTAGVWTQPRSLFSSSTKTPITTSRLEVLLSGKAHFVCCPVSFFSLTLKLNWRSNKNILPSVWFLIVIMNIKTQNNSVSDCWKMLSHWTHWLVTWWYKVVVKATWPTSMRQNQGRRAVKWHFSWLTKFYSHKTTNKQRAAFKWRNKKKSQGCQRSEVRGQTGWRPQKGNKNSSFSIHLPCDYTVRTQHSWEPLVWQATLMWCLGVLVSAALRWWWWCCCFVTSGWCDKTPPLVTSSVNTASQ